MDGVGGGAGRSGSLIGHLQLEESTRGESQLLVMRETSLAATETTMMGVKSARHVNLAILRSKGHSGSLWLTELLTSLLPSSIVFHEFHGVCNPRLRSNSTMERLFTDSRQEACQCALTWTGMQHHPKDNSLRFCTAQCGSALLSPQRTACKVVGFVTDPAGGVLKSLRALSASGSPVFIARLLRLNGVKQAISSIRDGCRFSRASDRNHFHTSAPSPHETVARNRSTSRLFAPPRMLLRMAAQFVEARFSSQLVSMSQHDIVYERLQDDAIREIRALLDAAGLHGLAPPPGRKGLSHARALVSKTLPDDLSSSLLNFDETDAHFRLHDPCLHRMLLDRSAGYPRSVRSNEEAEAVLDPLCRPMASSTSTTKGEHGPSAQLELFASSVITCKQDGAALVSRGLGKEREFGEQAARACQLARWPAASNGHRLYGGGEEICVFSPKA